jgi:glycosyltransferase involved in cell wall biosynthesis
MHIAIIHHHLHPGGVTRVIESQLNSLLPSVKSSELSVHTGDASSHLHINITGIAVRKEKSIQYLPEGISNERILAVFQKITLYLEEVVAVNDILHIHNLNLGKNPLLTLAVYRLASRGIKIVNHCHDFAEDRPGNYAFLKSVIQIVFQENLPEVLYPPYTNYHYVVLTSRDYKRLTGIGIRNERISLLPNPVTFRINGDKRFTQDAVKTRFGIDLAKKICLYPVRAIHRKNIGEFILLSVLLQKQASWLIAQPPLNPVEKPEYVRWKDFCTIHAIPVIFEAGNAMDIHDLMPAVDLCITTSTMEGFGLSYMEPWLAGIPVVGRNIEYCTVDLKRNGIEFPLLYDRFIVSFNSEKTDFKDLDQEQQQQIVQDVLLDPEKGKEIQELNPFLKDFFKSVHPSLIERNQRVIVEKYSLEGYGQQLYGIYKKLLGGT